MIPYTYPTRYTALTNNLTLQLVEGRRLLECNQMPNLTDEGPKKSDALARIFTGHHWASLGITGGQWALRASLIWPYGVFFFSNFT